MCRRTVASLLLPNVMDKHVVSCGVKEIIIYTAGLILSIIYLKTEPEIERETYDDEIDTKIVLNIGSR